MPLTHAQETGTRKWYQKLARKIWRKFITVSCTKTTRWPITLHGLCHVADSFCDGIELCSIACKKLLPEKNWYQIYQQMCEFEVPDDLYQFLVPVSWACVAGITSHTVTQSTPTDNDKLSTKTSLEVLKTIHNGNSSIQFEWCATLLFQWYE